MEIYNKLPKDLKYIVLKHLNIDRYVYENLHKHNQDKVILELYKKLNKFTPVKETLSEFKLYIEMPSVALLFLLENYIFMGGEIPIGIKQEISYSTFIAIVESFILNAYNILPLSFIKPLGVLIGFELWIIAYNLLDRYYIKEHKGKYPQISY